jgi:hypothetical protein
VTFKKGDIAIVVGSDYDNDPDIGKSVELLESFPVASLPGYCEDEGVLWRVNRMICQWDAETETRIADEPFIGEVWLLALGEKEDSGELEYASEVGGK